MRDLSYFSKIFLAVKPVDFRKQAHGLGIVVTESLKLPLISEKTLFAFTNRNRTAAKLLHWDGTGFALWWKVLERDRFKWPKDQNEVKQLQSKDLKWLLDGVDLKAIKKHEKLTFT